MVGLCGVAIMLLGGPNCEGRQNMACVHLRQLYQLCQQHDLKLGGSDLIHVVCHQCNEQEVCPSTLTDEYDAKQAAKPPAVGDQTADDSATAK